MIDVTATMDGPASAPQCSSHWRRASAIGSKSSSPVIHRSVSQPADARPSRRIRLRAMPERAAIVTGASRGIGLALAETLADEGYALTVSARKPDTLEAAAERLRERGVEVEAVPANLADPDAAAEDHNALVVNLASLAGKAPQPWLSVYSATKAAVVSYTVAMNKELANDGIKSVALCPGFVDTDMADFIKETIP